MDALKAELLRIVAITGRVNDWNGLFFSKCSSFLITNFVNYTFEYPIDEQIIEMLYTSGSIMPNTIISASGHFGNFDEQICSRAGPFLMSFNLERRFAVNVVHPFYNLCECNNPLTLRKIGPKHQ